jgi:hypothetical protein
MRSTREEMMNIYDDTVGVIDIAEVTWRIDNRISLMENKFNALDTKLNIILSKIDKNL